MIAAFACGREISYPRNSLILQALRKFATVEIFASDKPSLTKKIIHTSWQLLTASVKKWEVCFLGFYGQPLVFPTRLRWRGPLILDAFVSTYDTLCFDRQIIKPHSILGQLVFLVDLLSCRLADIIIVDTKAQAQYFESMFGVPRSKVRVLYVGCDDALFHPYDDIEPSDPPIVLFYGTFLPLHGVDVIIRAANHLRKERVLFQIVGTGQEYRNIVNTIKESDIPNVELLPPVPLNQLPALIARATICLGGHFGRSDKARRVIAGKTFQCLAMGKPTIVGDNPANREIFTHRENVYMCAMSDPIALANAISDLLNSPSLRTHIGMKGRELIENCYGNLGILREVHAIVKTAQTR